MRITMMALKLFFQLPYFMIRFWHYGRAMDKFVHHEAAFAFIKKATVKACRAGRVTIAAKGAANLPAEKGFIMYCNHQGLFDTLVFLHACPMPFSFLSKIEVGNIILIKQIMAALGAYPMDRNNLRQAMGVINSVAADVQKGKNFLIFPEGTRSPDPCQMGEFKSGSFKCATKAKCPIVPCVLIDSHKPFDIPSIKPVTVSLRYLPPIYYEEYKGMKTVAIAAMVRERIARAAAEMQAGE